MLISYSRLVALPLIMLSPLFGFFLHHDYSFTSVEAVTLSLGFALIGIIGGGVAYFQPHRRIVVSVFYALALVFVIDIQIELMQSMSGTMGAYGLVAGIFVAGFVLSYIMGANFSGIMACAFGVYILSMILLPNDPFDAEKLDVSKEKQSLQAKSAHPLIFHILLDAHIGIEGIPTEIQGGIELKKNLKTYFSENGFKVYGGAYTRYDSTSQTLAEIYSFSGTADRLEYFKKISALGMDIKYFGAQKPTVNYCADNKYVSLCRVKDFLSVGWIQNQGLSFSDRITVLTKSYLHTSDIYIKLNAELFKIRNLIDPKGDWWPEFSWEENILAPTMTAFATAEELKNELGKATLGEAYFAHFILPHAPYMYDQKCELKGVKDWIGVLSITGANTLKMRQDRYLKYFDQVKCAQRMLTDIFEVLKARGLYEDAVIVVHGDHGSRINVGPPFAKTKTDFRDRYSALLAIKLPGGTTEYEIRPVAIPNALKELNFSDFKRLPNVDEKGEHQTVYVRSKSVQSNFLSIETAVPSSPK